MQSSYRKLSMSRFVLNFSRLLEIFQLPEIMSPAFYRNARADLDPRRSERVKKHITLVFIEQSISRIIPPPIGISLIPHSPGKYLFQCPLITSLHIGNSRFGNKDGINFNMNLQIQVISNRKVFHLMKLCVTVLEDVLFPYIRYIRFLEDVCSSIFIKILPEIFKARRNFKFNLLDIRKMSLASLWFWAFHILEHV